MSANKALLGRILKEHIAEQKSVPAICASLNMHQQIKLVEYCHLGE